MVVLMEYSPGVAMKRRGVEELGDGDSDGLPPLSCRATKIRRLGSAVDGHDVPAAPEVASVVMAEGDVMMGEEPSPSPGAADGEGAVVVYDPTDRARAGGLGLLGQWRLRPWVPLRAGTEWIRDMLREADGRTVRAFLASAQEEGAADLAVVPWGATVPSPAATEPSTAAETTVDEEEDTEATAAMDVEEDTGNHRAQTFRAGCRDGHLYRWPQHCMPPPPPPPPLTAVGQASPAMWSW